MFSRNVERWMMLRVSLMKKSFVVAALFMVVACSKEPATPSAPTTPLVEQHAADPQPARVEEFRGSFAPGGIAASYRATFSNGLIQALEETREPNARTGAYEFLGARLMKYQGAALDSAGAASLEVTYQFYVEDAGGWLPVGSPLSTGMTAATTQTWGVPLREWAPGR